MLLSRKTKIHLTDNESNIVGHMCYAAYKLWNVCNYERLHYQKLNIEQYPNWYYQKKVHKDELWFKQLPSQTAQEVCKLLDKGWKSFFALKKSGGVENPK
ncbi:MAG: transposase, partial [Lachnospiraceae bacterium]|nr:transposase [Lachnospiraceae bacterium]